MYLSRFLYEIYINFIGIVGEIGETDDELFIWTHKKLDMGFDGDKVRN